MVDGRLKDPFESYGVKYRAKSKRQRRDESREQFVARVQKTFPAVIMQLNANFEAAALAYGIEDKILKAIVAQNKKCSSAYTKARAIAAADLSKEEANLQRSNAVEATEKDTRLKRKHWPVDPEQKEADAHDALLVSIVENEGNLIETGKVLNLDTTFILEMMRNHEDLLEAKELGMEIAVMQSEAMLATQAKGGNMTAIKMLLTNRDSQNWSDKQSISVNHSGFQPPEENKENSSGNVLELIKGKKNA